MNILQWNRRNERFLWLELQYVEKDGCPKLALYYNVSVYEDITEVLDTAVKYDYCPAAHSWVRSCT